jgi:hypothetical protein
MQSALRRGLLRDEPPKQVHGIALAHRGRGTTSLTLLARLFRHRRDKHRGVHGLAATPPVEFASMSLLAVVTSLFPLPDPIPQRLAGATSELGIIAHDDEGAWGEFRLAPPAHDQDT